MRILIAFLFLTTVFGGESVAKSFEEGDAIRLSDYQITIMASEDGWVNDNQFLQAEKGHRLVSVDIVIENVGSKSLSYNPFNFKLQDNNGYVYDVTAKARNPGLNVGKLQPGRKVRGFIVFELPNNAHTLELIYQPNMFADEQAIIKLGAGELGCESFKTCRLDCPTGTEQVKTKPKGKGGDVFCVKGEEQHGPYYSWTKDGTLEGVAEFTNGKLKWIAVYDMDKGRWKRVEYVDGKPYTLITIYHKNKGSSKRIEGHVLDDTGALCGAITCWNEEGVESNCPKVPDACKATPTGATCPPCE